MIGELIQDLSLVKDNKSAKFPHGFMSPLEKRLQGVLVGTEKLPGYNDAVIKRTFAEAYTAFTEQGFRRRMDKERRVEDLVLIFYSNATKALQKGKSPEDDSWKPMVDRHVALFVRLISATLKDQGNDKDKPELMTRLSRLESKLLTNDQDLVTDTSNGGTGATIEVVAPLSTEVKDMPLAMLVGRIFGIKSSQLQTDIDVNKKIWTEEAALTDLKSYQHCLNAKTKRTLRSDDFDVAEAYQEWRKAETPELSQLMSEILKAKPELVKSASEVNKPLPPVIASPISNADERTYPDLSRSLSPSVEPENVYSFDQSADTSGFSVEQESPGRLFLEQVTYTFTPPDPKAYYKTVLIHAMTFDLMNAPMVEGGGAAPPLSKQSLELLHELGTRWRLPSVTRTVLFLDVAAQKFLDQEIGLDELDAAFQFAQNPPIDTKKPHAQPASISNDDRRHWSMQDFALYRLILTNLHDALLRDLYDIIQQCFESNPPSHGPIMLVLESHVYSDPAFSSKPADIEAYKHQLEEGLRGKAAAVYRGYLEAEIPQNQEEWNFFHVVQLGKSVVKLTERIQKRYRKSPDVMGVNPLTTLVETIFPSFEHDASDLVRRILQVAQTKDSEVDLQDGFDLYKELVEIRRIHQKVLPSQPFAFSIEELLADFVWRWIRMTESRMVDLVDQAIKQDQFQVRSEHPEKGTSSDDERHSVSIIDVFRVFSQTTDQIFQLEWDNDVQYARFMTALARTFGVGLARYCEVIEQRFTKEMDRLSPAQEVAAVQSKQEKWMQLAKDAWNNKEKIEPFQFYAEVCAHTLFP